MLDQYASNHLQEWCDKQFGFDNAVEDGIKSFLASLSPEDVDYYLGRSWWDAYDAAIAADFLPPDCCSQRGVG